MNIFRALDRSVIHLINPMNEIGGSEYRTYEMHRHLDGLRPRMIWATARPHPAFVQIVPMQRLQPRRLLYPMRGTLVFVSSYFNIGRWLRLSRPERVIVICNLPDESKFWRMHRSICDAGLEERLSVAYASEWMRNKIGLPGSICLSPVDIGRFRPSESPSDRPFTIGRLSRDAPGKHHQDDPALYKHLASRGIRVRLMGGTCLKSELGGTPNIELLPPGSETPDEFLRSLDVFFYRTSRARPEPHGRVVTEALASGLPIVAEPAGGVGEWIRDGLDGYQITNNNDAISAIDRLFSDQHLRRSMSRAARELAETVFSAENIRANLREVLKIEARS